MLLTKVPFGKNTQLFLVMKDFSDISALICDTLERWEGTAQHVIDQIQSHDFTSTNNNRLLLKCPTQTLALKPSVV